MFRFSLTTKERFTPTQLMFQKSACQESSISALKTEILGQRHSNNKLLLALFTQWTFSSDVTLKRLKAV